MIPVAFAFDNALTMPAAVAISSLMRAAKPETKYHVFVLHSAHEELDKEVLDKVVEAYPDRLKLTYREVGNDFDGAFEIRGITTPAYYRLLIPELIPEYDKVIYADADIIFRQDLTELFETDLGENLLAATLDVGLNYGEDGQRYIASMAELTQGRYLQSGFIMLNCNAMRSENTMARFRQEAKRQLKYQDQDILNIVCKGRVKYLPPKYNMTVYNFEFANLRLEEFARIYTSQEIDEGLTAGNIHYNGNKPWRTYAVNFDIWWEEYRKSPVFDKEYYFSFFFDKLDEYDRLPLMKRIKILARYFVVKR